MDDLIAFLDARLDEEKAAAWAVHDVSKCDALLYEEDMAAAARRDPDCDCGYPARVLREVQADRKLLDLYERAKSYRDQVFARPEPRSISDEMRAVTQMMALEQVLRLRAEACTMPARKDRLPAITSPPAPPVMLAP